MTSNRSRLAIALLLAVVATGIFWRTAYPTITWWDSSSYSLAAATLGITSAPGSLLLTLIGWLATRLPLDLTAARTLNLLAGVLGALAIVLVYGVALQALRPSRVPLEPTSEPEPTLESRLSLQAPALRRESPVTSRGEVIGAALGAAAFGFAATTWEHAIKFTPYILTAVFTGLILLVMLRWWERAEQPDAWRWLGVLGLLFGLDFSVHRTNALLLPALLVWILIRHPRTLLQVRAWLAGGLGLALGLSLQLAIIPISASTDSPLNMFEPSNWSRFWDYVSLAQFGGGFLFDVWSRNAELWSVQVADLLRAFAANFLGGSTGLPVLGCLPAVAAVLGWLALWRRSRRLAIAVAAVVVLQAALTVLYFNIPANFFRPFDRHYLPVFVSVGVLMACGLGAVIDWVSRTRPRLASVVGLAALLVPASQLAGNWRAHDATDRWFAHDFAINLLEGLPPNAVVFTVGDNDSFPVWYVQSVEGVRRDVVVVNLSMANTSWYLDQLERQHAPFPLTLTAAQREAWLRSQWRDSTIVVRVLGTAAELGLPPETAVPDSITAPVRPTYGDVLLPADVFLIDLARTNAFQRPLTFAVTAGSGAMTWLAPYARVEGMHWRIVPVQPPPVDPELLRRNLLERYVYRGYADPSVPLDQVSQRIGMLYYEALDALLDAEEARGAMDHCRAARDGLEAVLPPARIGLPAEQRTALERRCG
ncbi:MAG TPA: DUF2723 domain-containing protein [Gemmatimonadaceae bacterium]